MTTFQLPSNSPHHGLDLAKPLMHCLEADGLIQLPAQSVINPSLLIAAWNYVKLGRRVILSSVRDEECVQLSELISASPDFSGLSSGFISLRMPAAQRRKTWTITKLVVANFEVVVADLLSGNVGTNGVAGTLLMLNYGQTKTNTNAIYAELKKRYPIFVSLWTSDESLLPPEGCPKLNWRDWTGLLFPDSLTFIRRPFCIYSVQTKQREATRVSPTSAKVDFFKLPTSFAADSRAAVSTILQAADRNEKLTGDSISSKSRCIEAIIGDTQYLGRAFEILQLNPGGYRPKWK